MPFAHLSPDGTGPGLKPEDVRAQRRRLEPGPGREAPAREWIPHDGTAAVGAWRKVRRQCADVGISHERGADRTSVNSGLHRDPTAEHTTRAALLHWQNQAGAI